MKKISAIALSLLLLCNCCLLPVSAELALTVYWNGEPSDITCESTFFYPMYLKYVPLAKNAGYTTRYAEETDTVISVKPGREISFQLGSDICYIIENGRSREYRLTAPTSAIDGSAYLSIRDVKELFSLIPNYGFSPRTIELYDPSAFITDFRASAPDFCHALEAVQLPEQYMATLSGGLSFLGNSDKMGYRLHGTGGAAITIQKQADAISLKGTITAGGLLRLLRSFVSMSNFDRFSQSLDDKLLDTPITIECFLTEDAAYIRSNTALLGQYYSNLYRLSDESRAEIGQLLTSKWIKFTDQDYIRIYHMLSRLSDPSISTDVILRQIISSCLSLSADGDSPAAHFAAKKIEINAVAALLQNCFHVETAEDGTNKAILQLTDENFYSRALELTPEEQREEYDKWSALSSNSLVLSVSTSPDGTKSLTGALSSQIDNFPNDYDIQFGKWTVSGDLSATLTPGEQAIAPPEEFVTEQYIEERIQELYPPAPEE